MNEPTIRLEVRPEVAAFVDQVRARLADLGDEEREELVGGLEGDIDELVSDGGSVAELGDPRAYADELRAAAGLERMRRVEPVVGHAPAVRAPFRTQLAALTERVLDGSRRVWDELVSVPGLRLLWEVAVALRPAWWLVRAWAAVQLLSLLTSTDGRIDVLPRVGPPGFALGVLLVAVVVSVQIGRGRLWPGTRLSSLFPRLLLLGLNVLAVFVLLVVVPLVPTQDRMSSTFEHGYSIGSGGDLRGSGLMYRGAPVENVFPYDTQGNPLTGVQLFDQDGRPLQLARHAHFRSDGAEDVWTVTYPWFNGGQALRNVVPLPGREQTTERVAPGAWTSANPPALPLPPLAVVPPATLPLPGSAETAATDDSENAEGR
jgi:hypothetical protein